MPAQALQTIPITWPFAVWGLDLVGPLQKAPGGFTHLLVAIDKFSKWIEVRPLNSIRSEQAVAFLTNIIYRFRVPNSIITDNGTQFTGRKFLDFCEDHHIRVDSARYQQSLRRYHARGVRSRDLQVGDLVLRLRQDARGRHKLTPPWEGPFIIAKILKPRTYKLANSQGEVYNNAWNIRQLHRFYP
jgi:transposase InsO family protein